MLAAVFRDSAPSPDGALAAGRSLYSDRRAGSHGTLDALTSDATPVETTGALDTRLAAEVSRAADVRHHLPPRRGQDDAHREAAALRRRHRAGRRGRGRKTSSARRLRLDGRSSASAASRSPRPCLSFELRRTATSTCSTPPATRTSARTPTGRSTRWTARSWSSTPPRASRRRRASCSRCAGCATCRVFTFVNKMDLPGRDPFDLLQRGRGRARHPRQPAQLADRQRRSLPRRVRPGSTPGDAALRAGAGRRLPGPSAHHQRRPIRSSCELLGPELHATLIHDTDLIAGAGTQFDQAEYLAGRQTPVLFGSALDNFGLEADPRCAGVAGAAAAAATGRGRHARLAGRAGLLGVRLQNPGEPEPQAPRPSGVRAHLLGRVREGHDAWSTPARARWCGPPALSLLRRPARDGRARLSGRRPRPAQPRQVRDRRHALRRRAGALPESAALPGRALRAGPPARHATRNSSTPASSSSRKRA